MQKDDGQGGHGGDDDDESRRCFANELEKLRNNNVLDLKN
jgi:hypothetical protein